DDYMTPFNWNPAQAADINMGWVFGTELNRLVINEAYIEWDNDPNDMNMRATRYIVNVWAELHNPMAADANQPATENGASRLTAYQLCLGGQNPGPNPPPKIRDRENVTGNPDVYKQSPANPAANCIVGQPEFNGLPQANQLVAAGGFFIVGPQRAFPLQN